MPYNDVRNEYKKNQVNNANQGKLIVMLYEGAIKFINNAIDAMPKKEIEKIHTNIVKAQDILTELTTSLNMDAGEIAQKLFSIYMYLSQRLTDANIKKSKEPLIEVKKHLTVLKDAWVEASKKVPANNSEIEKGGVNIAT